jgi:hypothetical protein
MFRISMLFAAMCIAAAPVVAATNASAQQPADKPAQADKADKTNKPESEKAEKFDLDGLIRGIKEMVDKQIKEDKDKPATAPAK